MVIRGHELDRRLANQIYWTFAVDIGTGDQAP